MDRRILLINILHEGEVSSYCDVVVETTDRFNTEKRKMEDRCTYRKAFLQIMNLWEVNESVRKFTLDISVEMGVLTFASSSQELGFMGNLEISDKSKKCWKVL